MTCIQRMLTATLLVLMTLLIVAASAQAASQYVVNLGNYARGDGSDETDAIQAAIDALPPANPNSTTSSHPGGILYVPRPQNFYGISRTLKFTERWNVVVRCESPVFGSRGMPVNHYFRWLGADNGTMFEFNSCKGVRVENLSMTGMDHVDLDRLVTVNGLTPIGRHTSGVTGIRLGPSDGETGFLSEVIFDGLFINNVDVGVRMGNLSGGGPEIRTIHFRTAVIGPFAQYAVVANSDMLHEVTFSNFETFGAAGAKSSIIVKAGEVLVRNWRSESSSVTDADVVIESGGIHVVKAVSKWNGPFLRTTTGYPEWTTSTSGSVNCQVVIDGVRHYTDEWLTEKLNTGVNPVPTSIIYDRPTPLHLIGCSLWGGVELGSGSMSTIVDRGTVFIDKDSLGFTGEGIRRFGRVVHLGTTVADNGRILEPYVVDRRRTPGIAPPTTGVWKKGDRILNIDPNPNNYQKAWASWVCTADGEPGQWAGEGQIVSTQILPSTQALLSDNFNGVPNSPSTIGWDINYNLAGRQDGTLATKPYAERPETVAFGPVDWLTSPYYGALEVTAAGSVTNACWVTPDVNLFGCGRLRVSVDMWPCTYVSTGVYTYDGYVAIGAPKGYTSAGAGLVFCLSGDDRWYMLDNGVTVASGYLGTTADPWNTRATFNTVVIDWNKVGSDYYASVSVKKGEKLLSAVQNYKVQSPITQNYVTLGTHGNYQGGTIVQSYFDNLLIETSGITGIKQGEDGDSVSTCGTVTGVFGDVFYVESPDRTTGIRVMKSASGVVAGNTVMVSGILATDATTGERFINAQTGALNGCEGVELRPLGMSNKSLGGGANCGQPAVAGGAGLNNIGLCVKVWGKVTSLGGGLYSLDDGSGSYVTLKLYSGTVTDGAFVVATGVVSCRNLSGQIRAMLLVESSSKVEEN